MSKKCRWGILTLATLSVSVARAGEWGNEKEELVTSCSGLFSSLQAIGSCGGFLFTGEPLHFMIPQSVVPGGGAAIGLTYNEPVNLTNWAGSNFKLDGGSSLQEFWLADATLTLSHRKWFGHWTGEEDRFQVQLYGRARGLPLMPFYGIGPNTPRSDLSDFRERDFSGGLSVRSPLSPWLNSGVAVEYLKPQVGAIDGTSVRSIDANYSEATAPGLAHQPGFAHYEISLGPYYEATRTTFHSEFAFHQYQDLGSGHYSFHKFSAAFLQTIYPESQRQPTGGGKGQYRRQPKYDSVLYIAGRFSASAAADGNAVPFYLEETLGGSNIDNVPTLRGFQDYRFRAPDVVSIQVQYERRLLPSLPPGSPRPSALRGIAGAVGILAFYDAGEVATKVSDLSLAHFRQSLGFGLTFWSGEKVWLKAYIGLGSGEGTHTFFGVTNPSSPNNLHL